MALVVAFGVLGFDVTTFVATLGATTFGAAVLAGALAAALLPTVAAEASALVRLADALAILATSSADSFSWIWVASLAAFNGWSVTDIAPLSLEKLHLPFRQRVLRLCHW